MEEMGDDEVMALVLSLCAGLFGAGVWYGRGLRISNLGGSSLPRTFLLLLPPLALGGLWTALVEDAAIDVRTDVRYQFLFVAMGSIWVFLLPRMLAFVGVSYTLDALERRNTAASIAIAGATAGLMILFTGSNMGEGPSIWNTVETAVAATALLFAAVLVLALATSVGDVIAIERDVATGVRFACWLVAAGIVLARASAGDWVSDEAMVNDLVSLGWPVVVLLAVAIGVDRAFRPRVSIPQPNVLAAGVIPGALYVTVSLAYVATLPHWSS